MTLKQLARDTESISHNYTAEKGISPTDEWYLLKIQEELGEVVQAYLTLKGQKQSKSSSTDNPRKALENEIADLLCHTLVFAKSQNIDIEKAIKRKWLSYLKKA